MKKNKLIIAGCSASDRGLVERCYGDTLSELLDMDYVHRAAGCGSNYRIWRTITSMIMSDEITSDDKLIIQYTTKNRREFWTSNYCNESSLGIVNLAEPYGDFGTTVKFKDGAYTWQGNKNTAKFFKQYQNEFVNEEYDKEVFEVNHYNFCNTLIVNNIDVVFLCIFDYCSPTYLQSNSSELPVVHISRNECLSEHIQEDGGHFTDAGHMHTAHVMHTYLKSLNKSS